MSVQYLVPLYVHVQCSICTCTWYYLYKYTCTRYNACTVLVPCTCTLAVSTCTVGSARKLTYPVIIYRYSTVPCIVLYYYSTVSHKYHDGVPGTSSYPGTVSYVVVIFAKFSLITNYVRILKHILLLTRCTADTFFLIADNGWYLFSFADTKTTHDVRSKITISKEGEGKMFFKNFFIFIGRE